MKPNSLKEDQSRPHVYTHTQSVGFLWWNRELVEFCWWGFRFVMGCERKKKTENRERQRIGNGGKPREGKRVVSFFRYWVYVCLARFV